MAGFTGKDIYNEKGRVVQEVNILLEDTAAAGA